MRVTESVKESVGRLVKEGDALWADHIIDNKTLESASAPYKTAKEKNAIKAYATGIRRHHRYQDWYTESLPVVKQLVPDRYAEFCDQYRLAKPARTLDITTYTVSDFFNGIRVARGDETLFDPLTRYKQCLRNQLTILRSGLSRLDVVTSDIRGALQAEMLDDQIATARELLKSRHLRAAGALAGVSLEAHLSSVVMAHMVHITKKTPTLSDYSQHQ